ncbi:POT family proton-dependent oligopeptide transporter [Novosphingobium kunmingense]|uniref:POT family proton-dependent oligopeptide transporter n=1 Tax=Novosphingobium kunmingense TaxID=1211806 RepID=A0A2N0H6I4_9SPHN|nr:peptide MFS transporter [Novosphingobium kunmingense]PKB14548.1 POT family proton-dependent oligopeptide transporter [Novosphingobium kunmingense]
MTQSAARPNREAFGQPRGLWVLAGTELWDRISFHGMQAMLVLYMTGDLLIDKARVQGILGFASYRGMLDSLFGPLTDTALATQTFGLYLAFVTGLPLLGGWLGDRFLGRRLSVGLGAALMTAGHFALAFDKTFLIALVLLMSGAGLLRGNLSAQIKALYPDDDPREVNAFQYYYFAVNFGAFIAPIVSGAVAAVWGWHAGFGVAGFGMLIGLIVYLSGARDLPPEKLRDRTGARQARRPLSPDERRRVLGLFLIWPVGVAFWIAQAQIWNVYNLWLRDHVDMTVGSFAVPVPWMQSLDGLAPAVFTPVALWLWARQSARGTEPDEFTKIGQGMILFALSVALLATGPLFGDGRAPLWLPVLFHVLSNFGAVFVAPVLLALFATRAPEQWRGTLIGINALSISAASLISGRMGSLYETMTPTRFWLINAAICLAAALFILLARGFYRSVLRRQNAEDEMPLPPKEETAVIADN